MAKSIALVALTLILLLASFSVSVRGSCVELSNCNGHGQCTLYNKCICNEGWGATDDITGYRAPDCSAKVCPHGVSWGDMPLTTGEVHRDAECSDRGICNRVSGTCTCEKGFEGKACQRRGCFNDCSGHGQCMTMERLAKQRTAQPLSKTTDSFYFPAPPISYNSSGQFSFSRLDVRPLMRRRNPLQKTNVRLPFMP
jgi:hypothetical protein